MSTFMGKLIDFLFQLSPYDREYLFKNHVVILGGIGEVQLNDFLHELSENDKIYNKASQSFSGIKIIVVMKDEPTETLRDISIFFTDLADNEVVFLKENIFGCSKSWYQKANLKDAKIVFAFSWKAQNEENSFEEDKMMSLIATGIKDEFQDLKLILILNSSFIEQFSKDSLYEGIQAVSPHQLNDFIIASSIVNSGFTCLLQHLITLKTKNVQKELIEGFQSDKLMLSYLSDMQQEIYQIEVPKFYVGMTFQECVQLLYLYGLEFSATEILSGEFVQDHINDDRKMTLIAVETKGDVNRQKKQKRRQQDKSDNSSNSQSSKSDDENDNEEQEHRFNSIKTESTFKRNQTKLLINPQNYVISESDILYVICENFEVAKEMLSIEKESREYIKYATNMIAMQKNLQNSRNIGKQLNRTFQHLQNSYKNEQAYQVIEVEKAEDIKEVESPTNKIFSDTYDFKSEQFPQKIFQNHILIFGKLRSFQNILQIIRGYTQKIAILFSEEKLDLFKWKEIKQQYQNIRYIRGEYLNQSHLSRLGIKRADSILILSQQNNFQFNDAIGICLARIITDQYDRTDFLIELSDVDKISFLNKNPKLKRVMHHPFFYPQFIAGRVHFTSMITSMLAKIVHTENWMRFLNELVLSQESDNNENSKIHTLKLQKNITKNLKYFGQLFFALLEQDPSIITIGLIKDSFRSKNLDESIKILFREEYWEKMMRQSINGSAKINKQINGILSKMLGNRIVLTNPSFYTPIEEGDLVIVIGDNVKDFEKECKKELHSNPERQECWDLKDKIRGLGKIKEKLFVKEQIIEELRRKKMMQESLITSYELL